MAASYWNRVLTERLGRRRALAATGAAALGGALLVACGGQETKLKFDDAATSRQPGVVWSAKNDWRLEDETKKAVRGGVYRGARSSDAEGHYDIITQMSAETPFGSHVYEMLFARNRRPGVQPGTTEAETPVGALAESWEFASDGLTVTYRMRQGVKWHPISPVNGRVMDLDDWKTSQERHLQSGVYRADILEFLDKVEFPDARTMVWKLKNPYAPLITRIWHDKFAFPIQAKELNANPSLAERTAIGTGYKILDKHQPSIGFEYRRHSDYWGGDPFIDRWHEPIIPEYANRYAQFVRGNIIDFTPTARDVLLLAKDAPQAVIVAGEIPDNNCTRFRFGRISPEKQAWADSRVRIAIRRSIDFKGISEFIANKAEFEAAGIPVEVSPMTHMPQNLGYWLNPEKGELGKLSDNYIYNVAEAKKLTAAAGFGEPIPIFMPIRLSSGDTGELEQLVIDSTRNAGTFRPEVETVASRIDYNRYTINGLFDGLLGTPSGSSDDADYFVMRDYHSKGRPGERQAYPDPRIDELGDASRRAIDLEKRYAILKEFQMVLAEVMPTIPSRHLFTTFSFRWPWLRNANYGETGSPPAGRPFWGGHLHWLDLDMPNRDKPA